MDTTPSTPPTAVCPTCGALIPADAPRGMCPNCLLAGAAVPTEPATGIGGTRPAVPSLARVAAAFPHLQIEGLIGLGGMGAVFKARQPHLDRWVALKILPESLAVRPEFVERFHREARLLARLNHPSIVTLHDFGVTGGLCFLLMEYVDGVNLRQAMRAGRFTPVEALALVPRICEALQFAHDEGVLHRDIKPENILLDRRGRVKIADFGIARLQGGPGEEPILTSSGSSLGTPAYMAPEQIENPASVDHRADIYSLGVVLYELLTGELPLGRFVPPSARTPLDQRVDAIVLRALAKEREARQQSATQFATEVERVSGRPPSPPPPVPPIARAAPAPASPAPLRPARETPARGATLSAVLSLSSAILALGFLLVFGLNGVARSHLRTSVQMDPVTLGVDRGRPSVGFGFGTRSTDEGSHSMKPRWALFLGLIPGLILAVPGLIGTLVGMGALGELREARGGRRGMTRALLGTMTWPCLVVGGGLAMILTAAAPSRPSRWILAEGGNWTFRVEFWWIPVAVVAGTLIGMAMTYGAWRWACGGSRRTGWPVVLATSGILLLPPCLVTAGIGQAIALRKELLAASGPPPHRHATEGLQATAQIRRIPAGPIEARFTAWSNGIPIDLPDLTFSIIPDPGSAHAWRQFHLRPSTNGAWTLWATGHMREPLGRQPARVFLGSGRNLISAPHGQIEVGPDEPRRWWPFLPPDDFPRGLDPEARADWGISVDFVAGER
ncbi:MAG: protein kinase [Verrucomicrobiae bacterium]|nr:protein kinase [Verrucomicrobiae bacterium]